MVLFVKMAIAILLLSIAGNSEASGGGWAPFGLRFLGNFLNIQNRVQEKAIAMKENIRDNIGPNIEKMVNVTADSAKEFVKTSKQIAAKVETSLGKMTNIINENLVPEVRHTGQHLRSSMNQIMNTAERLETRVSLSLDRFDEMAKDIGKNVYHGISLIVVIFCVVLFVVCNIVLKNCQTMYGTYELLLILTILSLITGIAVLSRMFLIGILQLDLSSTDIFKYCVLCPSAVVVGILVLKLFWKIFRQLSVVVTFFLQVPGLVIYIGIAGPALWTWRAYIYSGISKCKTPYILSVTLPYNTILIWFLVFVQMTRSLRSDNETSFLAGLLIAYLYMYCNALYLYKYHQRPTVQQQLRHFYSGTNDGKKYNQLCLTENDSKHHDNTTLKDRRFGDTTHRDGRFGETTYKDGRFGHRANATKKRNTTYHYND